jgi:hypothetical protein
MRRLSLVPSVILVLAFTAGCGRRTAHEPASLGTLPPDPAGSTSPVPSLQSDDTVEAAVLATEEARTSREPLRAPPEMLHYTDRKRFLAIQVAAAKASGQERPHDLASLARLIRSGQLEAVPVLGEDYVLDDVGVDAKEDPLTHYDVAANLDIPLLADPADASKVAAPLANSRRARDQARGKLIIKLYGQPDTRAMLLEEYTAITELARDFEGDSYELTDEGDRESLQSRMLSYVRPPTREVMLTLAKSYHEKFGRLLPVVSLIRTERYQRHLGQVNANATDILVAPHTTGQAFDITYRYMANDEQNFLMQEIAKLEESGRVEALRENRSCFHVFVFPSGARPSEAAISTARAAILADQEEAEPQRPVKRKARTARKHTHIRMARRR